MILGTGRFGIQNLAAGEYCASLRSQTKTMMINSVGPNQKASLLKILNHVFWILTFPENEVMYQLLGNVLTHKLYISRKLLHLRMMCWIKVDCYLRFDVFTWLEWNFFLRFSVLWLLFSLRARWTISDFEMEIFSLSFIAILKSQHLQLLTNLC